MLIAYYQYIYTFNVIFVYNRDSNKNNISKKLPYICLRPTESTLLYPTQIFSRLVINSAKNNFLCISDVFVTRLTFPSLIAVNVNNNTSTL